MAGLKASRGTIRWRPTPEQLMILEELFKGGMKCPTSYQVQKITAKLKEHGKVESKNVFYWFQNHKAREKQKLRKKLEKDFVYYNIYPHPQFACGFWPMFPAQVIKSQCVSSPAEMTDLQCNNLTIGAQEDSNPNESSWLVTWLATDHRHKNRPLETLQLFPTTTETTTSSGGGDKSGISSSSSSSGILKSL